MARYGNGRGAIPLLYIPAIGLFLCCVTSHMSSGRMVYAFSRDGAMLGARFLRRLGERSKQPVAGMWFMATLSWLIGLPAIFNEQVGSRFIDIRLTVTLLYLTCYRRSSMSRWVVGGRSSGYVVRVSTDLHLILDCWCTRLG